VLLHGKVALEQDFDHAVREEGKVELAASGSFIILIDSSGCVILNNLLHQCLVDIVDSEVIRLFSFNQEMAQSFQHGVYKVNVRGVFVVAEGEAHVKLVDVVDVVHDQRISK